MSKTIRKIKHDIEQSTAQLQALEAALAALPPDHPADGRAALQRQCTAEKQLLERLQDMLLLSQATPGKFTGRIKLLLVIAVLLAIGVFALFKVEI